MGEEILGRVFNPVGELIAGRSAASQDHLRAIERRHHGLIRATIEEQLWYEPNVETRNRKPLRRGPIFDAEWEIRFGPRNRFRVFYEVDRDQRSVSILAIGVKDGNRLLIGGSEVTG